MNTNDHSQNVTHTEQPCTMPFAHSDLEKATGRIPYNMTNDYMFRAVFQSSNKALRGLICSLLHLADSEVTSVEITNPILLGDSVDKKEFRLDIQLLLNSHTRIDLATEEDKRYHIDSWARLMKASTWEELRMTASEDEALYEAAKALYYTCSDEEIRIRCLEREEYYQDLRNYERAIEQERSDHELERLGHEQDLRNYEKAIEQQRLEHEQIIAQKDRAYQDVLAENEMLRAELERLKNT